MTEIRPCNDEGTTIKYSTFNTVDSYKIQLSIIYLISSTVQIKICQNFYKTSTHRAIKHNTTSGTANKEEALL